MITKITIENFYSFGKQQVIELNNAINILIGKNGTGKSNFIKAIQLLYEAIEGNGLEKIFCQEWGGFLNVVNFSDENITEISIRYEFDYKLLSKLGFDFKVNPIYKIIIKKNKSTDYSLSEHFYVKNSNKDLPPIHYLVAKEGNIFITDTRNKTNILDNNSIFNQHELILRQISDPDFYYPHETLKRAIKQIAFYDEFDTSLKGKIRQMCPYYIDKRLLNNGHNLIHLLSYLNTYYTKHYELILNQLEKINSNFKDLIFTTPIGSNLLLSLKEKELSKIVSIENISAGTLKFLLLMVIFYNPNRGKLICIENPEVGLHPDTLDVVVEGIKFAIDDGTQLIITTQSTLLISLFENKDLKIFTKDNLNQTVII